MRYEYTCPDCEKTEDLDGFEYVGEVSTRGWLVECTDCGAEHNVLALEQGERLDDPNDGPGGPKSDLASEFLGTDKGD